VVAVAGEDVGAQGIDDDQEHGVDRRGLRRRRAAGDGGRGERRGRDEQEATHER
jgi:hypothetical protein